MLSEASRRLEADHHSLGELLTVFRTALAIGDIKTAHADLDLFWARLAVHIRSEHIHLFPSILNATLNAKDHADGPSLAEAEATIQALVDDHDFFIRELSSAIMALRELLTRDDRARVEESLAQIGQIVGRVEQRLRTHNQTEEETIYRWVGFLLDTEKQSVLKHKIDDDLLKRPPRFDAARWQKP